jgi:hypothetical protein
MPAIFPVGTNSLTLIRTHATKGDQIAQALMAIMDGTHWVSLSAAAENTGANTITITGQIMDQDGQPIATAANVVVESIPVSGAGTITIGASGTLKAGSGTTKVWVATTSGGAFQIVVLNAAAEDNLIVATTDNGESEVLKLTFA